MTEKCGCKTKITADQRGRRGADIIIFCPLHEAAPAMLKALKQISRHSMANRHPGFKIAEMKELADKAISAAERS